MGVLWVGPNSLAIAKVKFCGKAFTKFQGKPGQWANVKYENSEFLFSFLFSIVLAIYIYIYIYKEHYVQELLGSTPL